QAAGGLDIVRSERLADVALMGARERDESVRAGIAEPRLLQLGAPAILIGPVGTGKQIAQAEIAGTRLRQQEQAIRLVAIGFVLEPDIAADDRLDPGLARGLVELHHAEDVAEVGQRQRGHPLLYRRLHRLLDADDAVYDRVFAMQAKVD